MEGGDRAARASRCNNMHCILLRPFYWGVVYPAACAGAQPQTEPEIALLDLVNDERCEWY